MRERAVEVLCVDDEPQVLEALALQLRPPRYAFHAATDGSQALVMLAEHPEIEVVVSDMRMPGMDGAELLGLVRRLTPDAARIVLTGYVDAEAAAAAVNKGQICSFLSKPCAPPTLREAVDRGAIACRMRAGERQLLAETLSGSLQALVEVLESVSPSAFGRAGRVQRVVTDLCVELDEPERWTFEVAAMLSDLGMVCVPEELARAATEGAPLGGDAAPRLAEAAALTDRLLGHIPRLERVRAIVAPTPPERGPRRDPPDPVVVRGRALLALAREFDRLVLGGRGPLEAVSILRAREVFERELLDALVAARGGGESDPLREVEARDLQVGMVLVEDLLTIRGILLVPAGNEVTSTLLARLRNRPEGSVREPIVVRDPMLERQQG